MREWPSRQRGGIEPLCVSAPQDLKSCPGTSLTHPGTPNFVFCQEVSSSASPAKIRGYSIVSTLHRSHFGS
eukprot:1939478-Lingulodinium_polyedra.AAC.1